MGPFDNSKFRLVVEMYFCKVVRVVGTSVSTGFCVLMLAAIWLSSHVCFSVRMLWSTVRNEHDLWWRGCRLVGTSLCRE